MSGAIFQALARNPLSSPDIIGVTAGATTQDLTTLVSWTSGTTSDPKGVVHTHQSLRAEADTIAGQYDLAAIRWSAMARRAWRAGLTGDDEYAEQLIEEARAFGTESAITGAPAAAFMQLGLLRWQQHRIAENDRCTRMRSHPHAVCQLCMREQNHGVGHLIGRVRLWVTTAPRPVSVSRFPDAIAPDVPSAGARGEWAWA